MKFLKKLFFVILKIVIVIVFTWLFLAVFWFNNLFNPIEMWNNFFGPQALEFANANLPWDSVPPPPQIISSLSVLGQISQLRDFIASPIDGVPPIITPIVLGYLLPFAMGLVFGGICLGILVLLSRFVSRVILKRPSKKSKRKGRYDKYDTSKKPVNHNPYAEKSSKKIHGEVKKPEYGYPDPGRRGYYDNAPRNYPPYNGRYEPEPYGYPDRNDPPSRPPYGYQR